MGTRCAFDAMLYSLMLALLMRDLGMTKTVAGAGSDSCLPPCGGARGDTWLAALMTTQFPETKGKTLE